MDNQIMQIILNVILVAITAVYAILTRRIAKSNELTVAAVGLQTENLIRPYITIAHSFTSETIISISIANTGKSNAENLRLQINKDFFQFGVKDSNLARLFVFQTNIETFSPNSHFIFPILSSIELQDQKEDNPLCPSIFTITATYSFFGKTVTETTTIDLRVYQGIWMPPKTIEERISDLTKEVKEIKEFIEKKFAT
jgi:hypothetical protein